MSGSAGGGSQSRRRRCRILASSGVDTSHGAWQLDGNCYYLRRWQSAAAQPLANPRRHSPGTMQEVKIWNLLINHGEIFHSRQCCNLACGGFIGTTKEKRTNRISISNHVRATVKLCSVAIQHKSSWTTHLRREKRRKAKFRKLLQFLVLNQDSVWATYAEE